jgi:hypothetical protein
MRLSDNGGEMRKQLTAVLAVAAAIMVPCTGAQEQPKNEVAGTIGRTFISDQTPPNTNFFDNTVHFGKGLSFEVNYARKMRSFAWGDLFVEVPAIFNPDEDLNYGQNVIPKEYGSIFVTPAARLNLVPALAISPWVSFGGGVGHFWASKDLVFFGTNTGHRIKTTGVLEGGVGIDVRMPWVFHSFKFRVGVRDDWSGAPPLNINTGKTRQHNYYVGGGLVYAF